MKSYDSLVERHLDTASVQHRWLLFLQHSATLAAVVTGFVLLCGVAMAWSWVTSSLVIYLALALIVLAGLFAWGIVALVVGSSPPAMSLLAAGIEQAHRPLLDRLNTLVFLREEANPEMRSYVECIEVQTRQVLGQQPPPFPLKWYRALTHVGMFGLLLVITIWFYIAFEPWQRLAANQAIAVAPRDQDTRTENSVDRIPAEKALENNDPRGEISISEPGRDIQATKLEIIPLQIAATANRPIVRVEWFSAINGGPESRHNLPTPEDPLYAVFHPEIVLEDIPVQLWDVMSYYATATCGDGVVYRSGIYFIGIVPFPDELEKLSGGRDSPSHKMLQQLTGMIEQQQEVLRQSELETRRSDKHDSDLQQRLRQLGAEERSLADGSRHLQAIAEMEFEAAAMEDLDEHFQRAEKALREAESALKEGKPAEVMSKENAGLANLVATRKRFQELLAKHPQKFRREDRDPQTTTQTTAQRQTNAQHSEDLAQMQKRLDQFQSVRKQLQSALLEQRNIERSVDPKNKQTLPQFAEKQSKLSEQLSELIQKNTECFGKCQSQCFAAQSTSHAAAQAMRGASSNAKPLAANAGDHLQQLDNAVEEQMARQRLANAHRLKQILNNQISQLGDPSQSSGPASKLSPADPPPAGAPSTEPGTPSAGNAQQLSEQIQQVMEQLQQIAEQEPTKELFGPALRESLAADKKKEIDNRAKQLSSAGDSKTQSATARQLQQQLRDVSRAFEAGRLGADFDGPAGRRESSQQSISQGLRQLESASRRRELGRDSPSTDLHLRRSAASNLQNGVWGEYGHNDRTDGLVQRMTNDLQSPEFPVDSKTVQDLIHQIQSLSREVRDPEKPQPRETDLRHLDPSRYPPEYRKSIEKYFQKLSEQP